MSSSDSPATKNIPLRRPAASSYLKQSWGLDYKVSTLAKLACVGGGPPMQYAGRFPMYPTDGLDTWAAAKIGPVVASTAERTVHLAA